MTEQGDEQRPMIRTAEAMKRTGWSRTYLTGLLRDQTLEGYRYPNTTEWFVYVDSLEGYLAKDRKPGPKGPRRSSGSGKSGPDVDSHPSSS